MSSEYDRQISQLRDEPTEQANQAPWADLELTIPNDRSPTAIISLVECALVELTHEEVGAEYVSSTVAGVKRTQFVAVGDIGETFHKRSYDERFGWHETTVNRTAVRNELNNWLSRSSSELADRTNESPNAEPDTFCVKPVRQL